MAPPRPLLWLDEMGTAQGGSDLILQFLSSFSAFYETCTGSLVVWMATDSPSSGRLEQWRSPAAARRRKRKGKPGSYGLHGFSFDTGFLEVGWIQEMLGRKGGRKGELLHGFVWRCLEIGVVACWACVSGSAHVG